MEKLEQYDVPLNRKPGVPPLKTLITMFPTTDVSSLMEKDKAGVLSSLGISTVEKTIKTCYIGPPIVETVNTTDNSTAGTDPASSRRKRSAGAGDTSPRVEGVSMLLPRTYMLGVKPEGADPIMDVTTATICKCSEPLTRLRKNVVVNQFVWLSGFSNPSDFDFKGQKSKWEKTLNDKLSSATFLNEFDYAGITILAMSQDPVSDTSINLQTEILFAVEANGTDIADNLDKINFGSQYYSNLTVGSYCDIANINSSWPDDSDPFLTLHPTKSETLGSGLVPSGMFAYYSCSDSSLYMNVTTLDLDQDGFIGIQCVGGEWDIDSIPTDANSTCISELACKPSDYTSQISAGGFKDPEELFVRPGEFLFLTCQNPENFLYNSLDPLPAILPLYCNERFEYSLQSIDLIKHFYSTGTLAPYKLDPTWPTCSAPEYCQIGGEI